MKFSNFTTSSGIYFNILSISKEIIMKLSERQKIHKSQNEPWSTGELFLLCHQYSAHKPLLIHSFNRYLLKNTKWQTRFLEDPAYRNINRTSLLPVPITWTLRERRSWERPVSQCGTATASQIENDRGIHPTGPDSALKSWMSRKVGLEIWSQLNKHH